MSKVPKNFIIVDNSDANPKPDTVSPGGDLAGFAPHPKPLEEPVGGDLAGL